MKSIRVLRTDAGLQLREGTSMHSDARAPAIRRVTRSGIGRSAEIEAPGTERRVGTVYR